MFDNFQHTTGVPPTSGGGRLISRHLPVQDAFPHVNVLLHDASCRELVDGLQNGKLELAIMSEATKMQTAGIEF